MKKRLYKYLVCSKSDNGIWFSSLDRDECAEYLSISYFKCQVSPYSLYIRKERLS